VCDSQVTLLSKDAETIECEKRLTAQRSATNLAEFNRTLAFSQPE